MSGSLVAPPERLGAFLQSAVSQFADVVLRVGKDRVEIPTSRFLLCAHSAFFQEMFSGTGKEGLQPEESGGRTVIPLEELDGPVVKDLLAALLTGSFSVTADGLGAFCKAVDFLQFQDFKENVLDAVKSIDVQKAKEGKDGHAAFLAQLAGLGDRYHFPIILKYASHVASHDPARVQKYVADWPASGLATLWARFQELTSFCQDFSSNLVPFCCERYTDRGICAGLYQCNRCSDCMPPTKAPQPPARCAVLRAPPSKCVCKY